MRMLSLHLAFTLFLIAGCAPPLPKPTQSDLMVPGDLQLGTTDKARDANRRDEAGFTPLHYAAMEGEVVRINALLEAGADVNARDEYLGFTPLHYAPLHVDAVRALLKAGADVNARDTMDGTPLHWAARYGNIGAVRALLEADADVNAQNSNGETPLHTALTNYSTYTNIIIGALLDAGANPKVRNMRHERPLDLPMADMLRIMPYGHETYRRLKKASSQ